MIGLLYLVYTLLMLTLMIWAVQLYRSNSTLAVTLAILVTAGLLYDNVVLYLGAIVGAGPLLLFLNWLRYLLEAIVAPFFVLIFADLDRRAGARWLSRRPAWLLVAAIIAVLMGYGVINLSTLALVPVTSYGAMRYIPATPDLPVIGIAITLAALVTGIGIWLAAGWPWLIWAALFTFVASGIAAAVGYDTICPVTNGAEIVLAATALECERRLHYKSPVRLTFVPLGR